MTMNPIQAREAEPSFGGGGNVAAMEMLGDLTPAFAESVLDATPDCVKLLDLEGRLLFMNKNGRCAMEVDNFDVLAGASWETFWPEDHKVVVAQSVAAAAEGRATRFEAYCPTAKGTPRWWDVSVAPVMGPSGRPERIVSISRDITERVERERRLERHEDELKSLALRQAKTLEDKEKLLGEKTLLMQEVDHRVKNSLAMITSMLHVQGRMVGNDEAREALARASARVQTIASVHERLYRRTNGGGIDLSEYLTALCRDLDATVGGTDISIESKIGSLGDEDAENAVTIGLIVTELVTNAVRHATPPGGSCKITVQCEREIGGKRRLLVCDDGCGLPDDFDPRKTKGLGMRVVSSGLDRLGGTLDFGRRDDGGTRFEARF